MDNASRRWRSKPLQTSNPSLIMAFFSCLAWLYVAGRFLLFSLSFRWILIYSISSLFSVYVVFLFANWKAIPLFLFLVFFFSMYIYVFLVAEKCWKTEETERKGNCGSRVWCSCAYESLWNIIFLFRFCVGICWWLKKMCEKVDFRCAWECEEWSHYSVWLISDFFGRKWRKILNFTYVKQLKPFLVSFILGYSLISLMEVFDCELFS